MCDRRLELRPRQPFGPREPGLWGWLKRACQWGLLLTVVACLFPAVMAAITVVLAALRVVTAFIPLGASWRMPTGREMVVLGTWVLWLVQLVLTALRLSGQWYRPGTMGLTGLALGALLYAAPSQELVGLAIQLLMVLVAAVQLLLNALWSLSAMLLKAREQGRVQVVLLLTSAAVGISAGLLYAFAFAGVWLLAGGLLKGAEYAQLAMACLQWAAWLGMAVLAMREVRRRSIPRWLWMVSGTVALLATAASLLLAGGAAWDELLLILLPLAGTAVLAALSALLHTLRKKE